MGEKGYQDIQLSVEYVKTSELVPYARNSKEHDREQINQLANSISKFGMNDPVGVYTNEKGELEIVEGHGRVLALEKMHVDDVPIIRLDHMTDKERRAYSHTHNQLTLNSGLDQELLALDMDELDFNWESLGFDIPEMPEVGASAGDVVEVDEPDEVEARVKAGDLWQLGEHRLICGDSTDAKVIERLMDGALADMVFTSPPYNGGGTTLPSKSMRPGAKDIKSSKFYKEYQDDLESDEYVKFASTVLDLCFEHTDGYIFWNVNYNANSRFEYIAQIVPKLPWLIEQIAWDKLHAIPQKGTFVRVWEPIYVFSTSGDGLQFDSAQYNYWRVSNSNANKKYDHKACFPVELPAKGIELVQPKTGIVLEPFCGSGTTLIAAEQMDRKCYGVELDPHFCDIIIARWEELTGKEAVKL